MSNWCNFTWNKIGNKRKKQTQFESQRTVNKMKEKRMGTNSTDAFFILLRLAPRWCINANFIWPIYANLQISRNFFLRYHFILPLFFWIILRVFIAATVFPYNFSSPFFASFTFGNNHILFILSRFSRLELIPNWARSAIKKHTHTVAGHFLCNLILSWYNITI